MPNLTDPRKIPALLRHMVFATLPAALGIVGCGGTDGTTGEPDTRNCGMCGCDFNGAHTETRPYLPPECDSGPPLDAGDDADASDAEVADGDATIADAASDTCPDTEGSYLDCNRQCGSPRTGYGFANTCKLVTGEAGEKLVECYYVQPCGRRPANLGCEGETESIDRIGAHLAEAAFLEAASIDAFDFLADELRAHGAPTTLVSSAKRAARDEIRHARTMDGLARRHGARAKTPRTHRPESRSLEAIALENAVEGCVRETYGALLAMWQGETAGDRSVRLAMRRIGRDEARHSALAWEVARWAERKLDARARARVSVARRRAIDSLREELARSPDETTAKALGLPNATHALTLVDRLEALLGEPGDRAVAESLQ